LGGATTTTLTLEYIVNLGGLELGLSEEILHKLISDKDLVVGGVY
jgi:hypothetical protein